MKHCVAHKAISILLAAALLALVLYPAASASAQRLRYTSPDIDAGDNAAVPDGITTDLDGNPRFVNIAGVIDTGNSTPPFVNMGAYEAQGVIYVDKDAPGPTHDGASWTQAFTSLQSALGLAASGNEIWVAEGEYYPGPSDNREATFQLKSGVALYGGFKGTETARTQRDWSANPTILSGDIDANETLTGNAYHVVTGNGTDATAILDGFTITAGNANSTDPHDRGGGMYNYIGSPTLANVTFSGNSATSGGGMYNLQSSPTLTGITFSGNSASLEGGGMFNLQSSPTLVNVSMIGNNAGWGAGISNSQESNPTLINAVIFENTALNDGGGIHNYSGSSPTLVNVTLFSNSAGGVGGGMDCWDTCHPTLTNVILWGNTAASGPQIYKPGTGAFKVNYSLVQDGCPAGVTCDAHLLTGDPKFVDAANGNLRLQHTSPVIDAGNNAAVPVEITTDLDGSPRFVDMGAGDPIVDMGAYEAQVGLSIIYVDKDAPGPTHDGASWTQAFTSLQAALAAASGGSEILVAQGVYYPGSSGNRLATFRLESGVALYGGFKGTETARTQRDWSANPTVLSGDIDGDGKLAGNAYHVVTGSGSDATAILDGFTITAGNANSTYPHDRGGGMYNYIGSPTLANVTFYGNSASNEGGGMFNLQSSPTLVNVSMISNNAISNKAGWGAGISNSQSNPTLINAVFFENTAKYDGGGIHNYAGSSPTLINVTLVSNSAGGVGGGMDCWDTCGPTLTNVILWGNTAASGTWTQIYKQPNTDETVTFNVNYSLVQYGCPTGVTCDHLLTDDPKFVGAANGNLHLRYTSPVIDAGNNAVVPVEITTDLDGNPRFVDVVGVDDTGLGDAPIVDMGAYEDQVGLPIIYVDKDAPGPTHDGASWTQAFTSLQAALAAASGGSEIWVAQGVYYPGPGWNRLATFQLESGVALYGGFEGTETARIQRDWSANPTILSGNIDRNGTLAGNAYHVVTGSGTDATAILDGFTITAGNADGGHPHFYGAGMISARGSPTLVNLTFTDNRAEHGGGGMYNHDGNPMLTNVTFLENSTGTNGGGMYNYFNSRPMLTNVTFFGNSAQKGGGGMYNKYNSSPTLADVTFSGNSAGSYGGGMYNWSGSPTLVNVTFFNNSTSIMGGGMLNLISSPTLTNVTFSGNSTSIMGGGMGNLGSNPTLADVTFSGNSATNGGGMYNMDSFPTLTNAILWGNTPDQIAGSPATVTYSDIQNGPTGEGNINADPLFVDAASGNLRLGHDSPAIDAGNNAAVPADTSDLDGDGNTSEPLPYDLGGSPRFVDVVDVVDTGAGTPPIVDMGAYEAQVGHPIIYVDKDAPGPTHDGASWNQAFTSLQAALAAASGESEIWVAQGVYYPGSSREATFRLGSGVALYGGFEGTETARTQRDWSANLTTLSGDIDGIEGLEGNAYRVVSAVEITQMATLDGFTITGANNNRSSAPDQWGGGLYSDHSNLAIQHVRFEGNSAMAGGGMFTNGEGQVILEDVDFHQNTATINGGGLHTLNGSHPTLTNVTFSANSTVVRGGGMYNYYSSTTLTNATFSGNSASIGGGMYDDYSSSTLANVTFSGNSAADSGGGMYNYASSPTLTNAILWGNTAANVDPQIHNESGSTPVVSYSDIQLEPGFVYGGTGNINADPRFADAATGNLRLGHDSPAIDAGNNAAVPGGIITDLDGNPRFVNIVGVVDTGNGTPPIVDMGAYEYMPIIYLPLVFK